MPSNQPLAGDWDGNGTDTVGVFRPGITGTFYLSNSNDQGYADVQFAYGLQGDKPLAGDWNSDGVDTIGVFRAGMFYLRNSNTTGGADLAFAFGLSTDLPIAGNWDGLPLMLPPTPTPSPTPVSSVTNASFTYDGDGKRVKSVMTTNLVTTTTYFVSAHYEVANPGTPQQTITKYYFAGSLRIAIRTNGTLNYLIGDHLGSTSLVTDANGQNPIETRYKAWGEVRYVSGNMPTNYQYTGQFSDSYINLLWYGSRHYDPELGRFISPDSIVPLASQGVQAYDRYAYVNNNPMRYTDPSGHAVILDADGAGCSFKGPACIIDMYGSYGDDEGMDRSLEAFALRHRDYDPTTDPELNGTGAVIVAAAYSRVGCYGGSGWDCAAMGTIALLSSPGLVPTAPSFSTDGDFYNTTVSCNAIECTEGIGASPDYWPSSAEEMTEMLGVPGTNIPDLSTTLGRNKVIWKTSDGIKITYEQHPYDVNAPGFHTEPHWHLDSPYTTHHRFSPGDIMPYYIRPR